MVTQSFVFLMLILNILYQIPFSCFVIHMDYHRQQVYMFHLADFFLQRMPCLMQPQRDWCHVWGSFAC